MTPTLLGRWQTRILLTLTVGVVLTLPFWLFVNVDAFTILFSLLFWGLLWDCLYTLMQKFRWDRDWPAAYQVAAGVWEAFFLLLIISTVGTVWHIYRRRFFLFVLVCSSLFNCLARHIFSLSGVDETAVSSMALSRRAVALNVLSPPDQVLKSIFRR